MVKDNTKMLPYKKSYPKFINLVISGNNRLIKALNDDD